jgi:SM-20-related protein
MNRRYESLISSYIDNQVGICNDFLSGELALALRQNLINLELAEQMKPAGIGNQLIKDAGQTKRGDKIFWVESDTTNPHERAFLDQVDEFIVYLNDSCYTGINSYEFHYALYETGSSYQRHKDQFQNNSDRKFSLINYLNTDWLPEQGGELFIYQEAKTEKILPSIQKAVFFNSQKEEHEVCKSTRPRMSITGWLKNG